MNIYIIIILLVIILVYLVGGKQTYIVYNRSVSYNKKPLLESVALYFIAIFLIIVSAIRYGIGTDYLVYERAYNYSDFENFDFLYKLTYKILKAFNLPYQAFIILTALISIGLITYLILKTKGINRIFSIVVFLGLNYYGMSFNMFRQFSSICIVMFAVYCYSQKKVIVAISLYIVAMGFHMSALLTFPVVIFLLFFKAERKSIIFLSTIAIVMFLVVPTSLTGNIVQYFLIHSGRFSEYLNATDTFALRTFNQGLSRTNTILFLPNIILIAKILCDKDYLNTKSVYIQYCLKIMYMYILIISFKIGSEMIDRFLTYFSITCVWVYPVIENYLKYKYSKTLGNIYKLIIILICSYTLIYQLNANVYQIVPYKTIFSNNLQSIIQDN